MLLDSLCSSFYNLVMLYKKIGILSVIDCASCALYSVGYNIEVDTKGVCTVILTLK